jgi:hypothetical protein
VPFVESALRERHPGLTSERRRRKAKHIAAWIVQALDFLENARVASTLTKPLPLFYASECLSKAVCLTLDPSFDPTHLKQHGLKGIQKERYFVRTLACEISRPQAGVWGRIFRTCNSEMALIHGVIDGTAQVYESAHVCGTTPLRRGKHLELRWLLRHLPEVAEDIQAGGWGHPFVVHVSAFHLRIASGPPEQQSVSITLRHAHDRDTKEMILSHEAPWGFLHGYRRISDELDILKYSAGPAEKLRAPTQRCDIFGRLYMDFDTSTTVLSEWLIYFAALFILADAARYQPQWKGLLDDHPEEAILVERFLELAVRKVPNLALNQLSGTLMLFKVAS